MDASATDARHWPVVAWIRLRLPEAPPPLQLTPGPPPPPSPPLEVLASDPVPTDPTVRRYSFEESLPPGGRMLLMWNAANPELLVAEYRRPRLVARVDPAELRTFWDTVRARVAELGGVQVEAADPRPA